MTPQDVASLRASPGNGVLRVVVPGRDGWPDIETPCPFAVDDVTYSSVVHWVEADRARAAGDADALVSILDASDSASARLAGAQVSVAGWDEEEALRWGLLHACHGTPAWGEILDATGADTLVVPGEDPRWRIGTEASPDDPATWTGENRLGFVWMDVREARREPFRQKKQPIDALLFQQASTAAPEVGLARRDDVSWGELFFSVRGSIGALDFLVGHLIAWGIAMVLLALPSPVAFVTVPVALLWYAVAVVALYTKRLSSVGPVVGGLVGMGHVALSVWQLALAHTSNNVLGWAVVVIMLAAAAMPAPARADPRP